MKTLNRYLLFFAVVVLTIACSTTPKNTAKSESSSPTPTVELSVVPRDQMSEEEFLQTIDNGMTSISGAIAEVKLQQDMMSDQIASDFDRYAEYEKTFLPKLKGKTIHVILQNHGDMFSDEVLPDEGAFESQEKIAKLLPKIKPKVLALEGIVSDRIASEKDIISELTLLSPPEVKNDPFFALQLAETYIYTVEHNRSLEFAIKNPRCFTLGGEFLGMSVLAVRNINMNYVDNPKSKFAIIQRFRTWNMLARLSEMMEKTKNRSGALVIGAWHKQDIEIFWKIFNVNIIYYDTTIEAHASNKRAPNQGAHFIIQLSLRIWLSSLQLLSSF